MCPAATADSSVDRREQILVAAERLFAEHGYHGTTMRMIAEEAGVKLSLIVYHFKAKLRLYREIFLRRQYVNERRRALLADVDPDAVDALDRIAAAFVDPVVELHDSPDDIWYARLVLREAADPSSQDRGIVRELFDPMAREFIAAIRRAATGRSEDFYRWAYLFAVGALTQSSFDVRLRDLATDGPDAGEKTSNPVKAAYLRAFIRAGWAAEITA
ncbi:TetR/AcrR family transcriptional regulator [Amycolatopsis sp. K13G38]|uniref:TetR/AcrR family transcriptional regulator n=1 Tax=Amycolatopsis acididurans TaxID=2724524 RepID=A0ABX1IY71_9PSEU|nr:TetR family transcriptional regulator [Amycolatopsis acididurans]NKQ52274.1 TetR/AcrR family transcriptional regulator [Amycolatopsis acididurans]